MIIYGALPSCIPSPRRNLQARFLMHYVLYDTTPIRNPHLASVLVSSRQPLCLRPEPLICLTIPASYSCLLLVLHRTVHLPALGPT